MLCEGFLGFAGGVTEVEVLHGGHVERLVDGSGCVGEEVLAGGAQGVEEEGGREVLAADPVHEVLARCHRHAHDNNVPYGRGT